MSDTAKNLADLYWFPIIYQPQMLGHLEFSREWAQVITHGNESWNG